MAVIDGSEALEKWLEGKSREIATAIAVRAALRVLPLIALELPPRGGKKRFASFVALTSAAFRCTALARVAGKYPTRANELSASAARSAALSAATSTIKSAAFSAALSVASVAESAFSADSAALSATFSADSAADSAPPLRSPLHRLVGNQRRRDGAGHRRQRRRTHGCSAMGRWSNRTRMGRRKLGAHEKRSRRNG